MMKPFSILFCRRELSPTHLLQVIFATSLTLTVTLHTFLPYLSSAGAIARFLSIHKTLLSSLTWCFLVSIACYISTRPRRVFLLDYSCFRPPPERRCGFEVCEYLVRRGGRFSTKSEEFMRGIYNKSGLGDETYAPPFLFETNFEANHSSGVQEAEEGMFSAVDALLAKSQVPVSLIDTVIVSSGSFATSPSLSSLLVNRYGLDPSVSTYNISGMGCGAGAMMFDMAAKILSSSRRRARYALVVATEVTSLNWYFGQERSMLVTNCIFRVGCAAALLTTDPSRRPQAKMEFVRSLRTHRGADEASYTAAFQAEDEDGNLGVLLKKDLIRVAGEGLKQHISTLGIHVLPLTQLLIHACNRVVSCIGVGGAKDRRKPPVPDFTTAFEHVCIHTGGKAVIESIGRAMRLGDEVTEPAKMTLHRFGNTSSSMIFYELAYFEAKGRVRKGDRMWMLAFGTGFKVCSVVWKALRDSRMEPDNPWRDCIHRYPLKAW